MYVLLGFVSKLVRSYDCSVGESRKDEQSPGSTTARPTFRLGRTRVREGTEMVRTTAKNAPSSSIMPSI